MPKKETCAVCGKERESSDFSFVRLVKENKDVCGDVCWYKLMYDCHCDEKVSD